MKNTTQKEAVATLENQIRRYLQQHPEVRGMLDLVRMTEEEYVRSLMAYQVPADDVPTIGSTLKQAGDVDISATDRRPGITAGTT